MAVKTDDIPALKQHIRQCLSAAASSSSEAGVGDSEEQRRRQAAYLSMHDGSRQRTTLLHWASYLGGLMAVKLLAHHGADVNATEADGKAPLHWAAFEGHRSIVEYLLFDCNARFDLEDLLGNTPCHLALLNEHMEVARLFPNYRVVVAGEHIASSGPRRSPRRTAFSEGLTSMSNRLTSGDSPPTPRSRSRVAAVPFGNLEAPGEASHSFPSNLSDSIGPMPAPSLSVRPISRSNSVERRPRSREEKEARRARKELKQQKLRDELFAKLVLEAPTPARPIHWLPSTSRSLSIQEDDPIRGNPRVLFHRQQSEPVGMVSSANNTPRRSFAAAEEHVRLPDRSLYSRSSTPTGRRSSTPSRARPEWRPPSRVLLQRTEERDNTLDVVNDVYRAPPRLSISRMNVRSY